MNKNFFSRVIMVIIVALLGIMFLAPSMAFCASAAEEQKAMVEYSRKIDVLNNLGCMITIYDAEISELSFKKFMKNHGKLDENEMIFCFKKVGRRGIWEYEIRIGDGLKDEYATLIEYDQSVFSSRDEWMMYIKNEHVDMIYTDVLVAMQPEATTDWRDSFKEFKWTIAECMNNVWNLFKSGGKHVFAIINENPVILAIIVFVVLGVVLAMALKMLVGWMFKMIWKLICFVTKNILDGIVNIMKKCFTRKARAN